MSAQEPEPGCGPDEAQYPVGICRAGLAPLQRGALVGVLGGQAENFQFIGEVIELIGQRLLDQIKKELNVCLAHTIALAAVGQPLQRIFADGFQHIEAHLTVDRFRLIQQTIVVQFFEFIQHIRTEVAVEVAHLLGGLQRPAADEDRQPPEQALRLIVEQVVTPVDRITQRLLAFGNIVGARRRSARAGAVPGGSTSPGV